MFATDPIWTFAAGQHQSPPDLTIVPSKRFWSGQLTDAAQVEMLKTNKIDALVLRAGAEQNPVWTNFLSNYAPAAMDNLAILYVRRELAPPLISVDPQKKSRQEAVLKPLGF